MSKSGLVLNGSVFVTLAVLLAWYDGDGSGVADGDVADGDVADGGGDVSCGQLTWLQVWLQNITSAAAGRQQKCKEEGFIVRSCILHVPSPASIAL